MTVWDVKNPDAAASPKFTYVRDVSQLTCGDRGWGYEVFTGLEPVHRHNLLWLHAYRRRPPWTDHYEDDLAAECAGGTTLGELVRSSLEGERLTVIWHLVWTGRLVVDLTERLTARTEVMG